MFSAQCRSCGAINTFDCAVIQEVQTAYIEHKHLPHRFVCENCGHIHDKGQFHSPHEIKCKTCGADLVKGVTSWL